MIPLILGLGASGLACANYFEEEKIPYFVFEEAVEKVNVKLFPLMKQVSLEEALHLPFTHLIPSPGVSPLHPLYQKAITEKKVIEGEIELALKIIEGILIGVTGTNGKTTVTKLLAEGFKELGYEAIPCGNFGVPLLSLTRLGDKNKVFCVELSSYQLETVVTKKLDAAVILNITQDHLDRYASIQDYAKAKWRIFDLLKEEKNGFLQKETFENFKQLPIDPKVQIYDAISMDLPWMREYAPKERENWIAAFKILQLYGMTEEKMKELLKRFEKPSHRIELIKVIDEISFYDDSKGTNVDAVIFAVEKFSSPVILLVGGKDKESDYSPWIKAFNGKVKKLFAYGAARQKIKETMEPYFSITLTEKLEEATKKAFQCAQKGDVVVLSPGCSSFDQFNDYKHRAKVFKECVLALST